MALSMDAPPVQYVTTSDGYSIADRVSGDGRPAVFVPLYFNHIDQIWRNVSGNFMTPWLEGRRFHFIQCNARGQGMSARGLRPDETVASFTRDIEALVQRERLGRFVLLSLGGLSHIAMAYALSNPQRVEALVLCCASVPGAPWPRAYQTLASEDWEAWLRTWHPPGMTPEQMHDGLDFLKVSISQADQAARQNALAGSTVPENLSSLIPPTLIFTPVDTSIGARSGQWSLPHACPTLDLSPSTALRRSAIPEASLKAIDDFLSRVPNAVPVGDSVSAPLASSLSTREVRSCDSSPRARATSRLQTSW
jgi:pimeloyl-ACP methyl ester carboxylesterase